MQVKDERLIQTVQGKFKQRKFIVERPDSNFPELFITVPDSWNEIILAPLYDVHIGNNEHDTEMFDRHLDWISRTPNVLTWNGGDMIENASKLSIGSGVYEQNFNPQNQFVQALLKLAKIQHKMLFAIPGNHEDRVNLMGVDVGQFLAWMLKLPYYDDYVFCTIRWRKNNFRVLAHHGSGGASTAGAQRMAARKSLSWAKVFDIYWQGHLHNPLVDVLYQTDVDQNTGLLHERNGLIIISPSYLKYFNSYAAKKQLSPGTRGLISVTLHEDGRIDTNTFVNGRRL